MHEIIVININKVLHPLSLKSMEDAAKRWSCNLRIIDTPLGPGHPAKSKVYIHEFVERNDKTLLLDADTFITEKAPNIFLLDTPAAVAGNNKHLLNTTQLAIEIEEELGLFGVKKDFYFNSGVLLVDSTHAKNFYAAQILDTLPQSKYLHWWDQTLLNISFPEVRELDERWNFIPQGRSTEEAFIIHLAGVKNYKEFE